MDDCSTGVEHIVLSNNFLCNQYLFFQVNNVAQTWFSYILLEFESTDIQIADITEWQRMITLASEGQPLTLRVQEFSPVSLY